jgi:hypothetical protein
MLSHNFDSLADMISESSKHDVSISYNLESIYHGRSTTHVVELVGIFLLVFIAPSLPWSRSVANLVCFLVALGVQEFILDLQSIHKNNSPDQISGNPIKNHLNPPTKITLSIVQLGVFAVVIMWSLAYIVMIHLETQKCMARPNALCGDAGQLEAGVSGQTNN